MCRMVPFSVFVDCAVLHPAVFDICRLCCVAYQPCLATRMNEKPNIFQVILLVELMMMSSGCSGLKYVEQPYLATRMDFFVQSFLNRRIRPDRHSSRQHLSRNFACVLRAAFVRHWFVDPSECGHQNEWRTIHLASHSGGHILSHVV